MKSIDELPNGWHIRRTQVVLSRDASDSVFVRVEVPGMAICSVRAHSILVCGNRQTAKEIILSLSDPNLCLKLGSAQG